MKRLEYYEFYDNHTIWYTKQYESLTTTQKLFTYYRVLQLS